MRRNFPSRRDRKGAFTLVELLVVIAIVAIVASLLLPALNGAKNRSRSTVCRSSLMQLQMAWLGYAGDNAGEMVPNQEGRPYGFWEGVARSWTLGNAQRDEDAENIRSGTLFRHAGGPGIYRCPSDHSKVKDRPEQERFRSYSLNGELNYWIMADQMYGLPILQSFHNESQLKRPSMTYAFLDVTPETIDSGSFGMPGPAARTEEELRQNLLKLDKQRWLHLPGYRHGGGANLSFLDGHVEHHEWNYMDRKPVSPYGHRPATDTDRQDMRWLVKRGAAWQRVFH